MYTTLELTFQNENYVEPAAQAGLFSSCAAESFEVKCIFFIGLVR